jgi:hypothetical protein
MANPKLLLQLARQLAGEAKLPRPTTHKQNPITGILEDAGEGPPILQESGGVRFDPFGEDVRSKRVIEGTTKPSGMEDASGKRMHHEIDIPGIEPRVKSMLADPATKDLPMKDLEEIAEQQFNAEVAAQRRAAGQSDKKTVGGRLNRKQAIKEGKFIPKGNKGTDDRLNEPRTSLDDRVIAAQDQSAAHRKITGPAGKGGPQKFRNADERFLAGVDLEGEQFADEVAYIEHIKMRNEVLDPLFPNEQHPRSGTSQVIKASSRATEVNAYIQDVFDRFNEMFPGFKEEVPLGADFFETSKKGFPKKKAKLVQGSSASKLNDDLGELSNIAAKARHPDTSEAELKKILKRIVELDNEYHGTDTRLSDIGGGRNNVPEVRGDIVKQFDDDTESFGALEQAIDAPQESVQFGRSMNELTRQRTNNAQQGPQALSLEGELLARNQDKTTQVKPFKEDNPVNTNLLLQLRQNRWNA